MENQTILERAKNYMYEIIDKIRKIKKFNESHNEREHSRCSKLTPSPSSQIFLNGYSSSELDINSFLNAELVILKQKKTLFAFHSNRLSFFLDRNVYVI